jgi:hypothetical protein
MAPEAAGNHGTSKQPFSENTDSALGDSGRHRGSYSVPSPCREPLSSPSAPGPQWPPISPPSGTSWDTVGTPDTSFQFFPF